MIPIRGRRARRARAYGPSLGPALHKGRKIPRDRAERLPGVGRVTTPDSHVGDVLADVTQRRGKVLGMESDSGRTVVKARVPEAELYKYAAALRAMTQGRAHHSRELVAYEAVPDAVAKRIIGEVSKAS
ncbi:MAG: hypothetical protein EXR92_07390 [Gemmatimonadetes bacterium]|nr:hypothetical protein [Gemmatimonadota bacterium]